MGNRMLLLSHVFPCGPCVSAANSYLFLINHMEKTIFNVEVPANKKRILHLPELSGSDVRNIVATVDGEVQRITKTDIEGRLEVEFLTVQPGQYVDLVIGQSVSGQHEISLHENDVLSISISDMTALRVLPLIEDRQFSSYTGSQFGLFLGILMAAGISASQLIQAFTVYGLKMFRLRLFDKRNRFSGLEEFCRKLIPNVDAMAVKDLQADIFIPLVNGSTGKQGFITKSTTPDLPVLSAVKCAVASLLDYVPLRTEKGDSASDSPFYGAGLIWSYATFSFSCPDLTFYRFSENKGMSYTTYASYPSISYKKPKLIKNHKDVASHFQADEIGKKIHLEEIAGIMSHLVSNYRFTLLDPLPVLSYANKNQIQLLLSGV